LTLASAHPEVCGMVHRWLECLAGAPVARGRCMGRGDRYSEYTFKPA
jgi:hypothetical protein